MALPSVVIVGRPNVGKSSLFNRLVGRRVAIVDAMSGVTRDRVGQILTHADKTFELVDTGGIGTPDDPRLKEEIDSQIQIAFDKATLVVFVVDARDGLTPMDTEVARSLRLLERPIILVANKVDAPRHSLALGEFERLGLGTPVATSAAEGTGKHLLLDAIAEHLGDVGESAPELDAPKVALVGCRNVGKSTLVNRLAGEQRTIVSPVPGTTRDSVDVLIEVGGRPYLLIDTAGVRRKKSIQGSVDFYGQARTERSIRRADVVLLVLDASAEISRLDKRLGRYISDHYKPCVIVLNKWDLCREAEPEAFVEYLEKKLIGLSFAPVVFTSAMTGFHVKRMFTVVDDLIEAAHTRISTSKLNVLLHEACERRRPAPQHGRVGSILYASQVAVDPPTIVLFVSDEPSFSGPYLRYLTNVLRRETHLSELPIRFVVKGRQKGVRGKGVAVGPRQ